MSDTVLQQEILRLRAECQQLKAENQLLRQGSAPSLNANYAYTPVVYESKIRQLLVDWALSRRSLAALSLDWTVPVVADVCSRAEDTENRLYAAVYAAGWLP